MFEIGDECPRYDVECPWYDKECPNSMTASVIMTDIISIIVYLLFKTSEIFI